MDLSKCIFLIVGPSGSGKDTVVKKLCSYFHAKQLKSYTTRPKRYDDEDCHIFVVSNKEDFGDIKSQYPNRVAETIFDNHFYFATKEQVEESDFYIIDPSGVEIFKEKYDGNKKIVTIFLRLSPLVQIVRLLSRGDTQEQIEQRVYHDAEVFKDIQCDYTIKADKSKRYVFNKVRHIVEENINEQTKV